MQKVAGNIYLGRAFDITHEVKPRNMKSTEWALWKAKKDTYPINLVKSYKVYYQVLMIPPEGGNYYIDIMIDSGFNWTMVELKKTARPYDVGQVCYYKYLWQRMSKDDRPVTLKIMSPEIPPAMTDWAAKNGVLLEVL